MGSGLDRKTFRNAVLVTIVVACIGLLALSYHPRARFAHPVTENFPRPEQAFHCYHDVIYGGAESSDALYFGASRTMFAIHPERVENAYRSVTGREIKVFSFSTAWANPELSYFFFRDYLEHNPPPRAAWFELTSTLPVPEAVRHVNPLYPYLAPPYLYLDELRSWEFVRSPVYGLSNFLRLHLRHIDLGLNNLLVADNRFWIPQGSHCQPPRLATKTRQMITVPKTGAAGREGLDYGFPRADSFESLMEAEALDLLPPGGWDKAGDYELLAKQYADDQRVTSRLKAYGPQWSKRRPARLWYRVPTRDRGLYYYRRILELGREHGVRVGFYILPGVYIPEPDPEHLAFLERKLGGPVRIIPFRYARVAYHHYQDLAHVKHEATGLMAAWAASLIDAERGD